MDREYNNSDEDEDKDKPKNTKCHPVHMHGPYINGPYAYGNGPYTYKKNNHIEPSNAKLHSVGRTPSGVEYESKKPVYMRGPYCNGPYAIGNGPYTLKNKHCEPDKSTYMRGPYINGPYAKGNGPYIFEESDSD